MKGEKHKDVGKRETGLPDKNHKRRQLHSQSTPPGADTNRAHTPRGASHQGLGSNARTTTPPTHKPEPSRIKNKETGRRDNMSQPYRTCQRCGSHLDHGERCTCTTHATPEPKEQPAAQPEGYRYEVCTKCKKLWQVSAEKVIPRGGYKCPYCANE